MQIQIDGTQTIETDTMSIEQLKGLKREMDDAIDSIEHQIAMAKAERYETGEYASAQWMAKANYALKRRRKAVQRLMEEIGIRRKRENIQGRAWSEYFVDVCKENLTPDMYSAFSAKAEQRRLAELESVGITTP